MRVIATSPGGYYMITDYAEWPRAFSDRGVLARVLDTGSRTISAPMHPMTLAKSGDWNTTTDQPEELDNWLQDFEWQEWPEKRLTDLPLVA